jgi:hypothetical protein
MAKQRACTGKVAKAAPMPLVAMLPQIWLKDATEMRRAHQSTSRHPVYAGFPLPVRWPSVLWKLPPIARQ